MGIEAKHAYRFGFLKSEEWDTIRIACLAHNGLDCFCCGTEAFENDVHHVEYPKQWRETNPNQTLVLCRGCHELAHADEFKETQNKWKVMMILRLRMHPEFNESRIQELAEDAREEAEKMKRKADSLIKRVGDKAKADELKRQPRCWFCWQPGQFEVRNIVFTEFSIEKRPAFFQPCCESCWDGLNAFITENPTPTGKSDWKSVKSFKKLVQKSTTPAPVELEVVPCGTFSPLTEPLH